MRHQRAVELLGAGPRLPPLKKHHAVGASRDRLVAPEPHLAGRFRQVDRSPVDAVGRLLHQHPGTAAAERAHQVSPQRRSHSGIGVARIRIRVVADDVLAFGPAPVIQRFENVHEVGGDRNIRSPFL